MLLSNSYSLITVLVFVFQYLLFYSCGNKIREKVDVGYVEVPDVLKKSLSYTREVTPIVSTCMSFFSLLFPLCSFFEKNQSSLSLWFSYFETLVVFPSLLALLSLFIKD